MSDATVAVNYVLILILVCFSALFSGLTLGLLGLDLIGLEIVMNGGDESLKVKAAKIKPVRENGNLLLCTLLLGNVAVNAYLSILMADLTSGFVGFAVSTVAIFLFGEIIRQASCSRYALHIGAACIPIVQVLILLMFACTAYTTYSYVLMLMLVAGSSRGFLRSLFGVLRALLCSRNDVILASIRDCIRVRIGFFSLILVGRFFIGFVLLLKLAARLADAYQALKCVHIFVCGLVDGIQLCTLLSDTR